MDLPGSSVHGILQARILEWVVIPFSGDLPNPGTEPGAPALQEDFLPSESPGKPNQCFKMDLYPIPSRSGILPLNMGLLNDFL